MSFLTIFLIAIGLSMDAFVVSISNGILIKKLRYSHVLKFGIYFGFFQFSMPIVGSMGGNFFGRQIETTGHFIAFVLLCIIGGKMICDSYKNDEEMKMITESAIFSTKNLTMLAIATSIDALAIGVSFAVMRIDILNAAIVIGITAFMISCFGVLIGNKVGGLFEKNPERVGGVILICMGLKILTEHMFIT